MSELTRFTYNVTAMPDMCGKTARLNPAAAFLLFQNAACMHAEAIGNGTAVLDGEQRYWVTTHSRIDFYDDAQLMDELAVTTWPNRAKPNAVRAYRGYALRRGDSLIAEGLTEWIVLGRDGSFSRFCDYGFPEDFEFDEHVACGGKLSRFRDEFSDEDEVYSFVVRQSSIDTGRHMNNVAYVRAFLDCFTADEVAEMPVRSMEARYVTACMEGETLRIFKKRTDDGYLLGLRRADGKCAAFLKISLGESNRSCF